MSLLVFFALVAALTFGLTFLMGRTGTFLIRLGAAGARVVRGRPPRGFVGDCTEIARSARLKAGEIKGVGRGPNLRLRFSDDVPPSIQQRFRNALQVRRR